jgi:hypothetical protein
MNKLTNETVNSHALTPIDVADHVLAAASLVIEYTITADMPDGQALPPYIDAGVTWCVVRRANGQTLWRRIILG